MYQQQRIGMSDSDNNATTPSDESDSSDSERDKISVEKTQEQNG